MSEIYRRYSAPMFAIAMSLLGVRDLAEEAVQYAFVQAWRGAARFDPDRSIQPWLYAITRRAAVDVYRLHRRTMSEVPLDTVPTMDTNRVVPEPSIESIWQAWQIRRAVARLHPSEQQVITLAYYRDMSQSEISAALGIPIGTVKSRTARALRILRSLLGRLREAPIRLDRNPPA